MELSTTYMGLSLRNPLVASPSPLSYSLDGIRRLDAGGVGQHVGPDLDDDGVGLGNDLPANRIDHRNRPRREGTRSVSE